MRQALVGILLLASCAALKTKPVETYDQMLVRTEKLQQGCIDLTYHDDSLLPDPDCRRIVDAWNRGRNDMARVYPEALNVKLGDIAIIRPRLQWFPNKPYPLLQDRPDHPRAYSYTSPYPLIMYAVEESIEHEAHHMIGAIVTHGALRTPEAMVDRGGYTVEDIVGAGGVLPLWFIFCHGTVDDPFGQPGIVNGCSLPYDGPANPLM